MPTHYGSDGVATVSMTTPVEGSSWPRRVMLLVVLAVVAAGGVFAVTRALARSTGPGSPDAVSEEFFDAIENEDLLAVLELAEPGERESLAEPTFDLVDELRRLGVFEGSADNSLLDGIDIRLENLTYSIEPVSDGLVVVETTGGSLSATGVPRIPLNFERFGVGAPELGDLSGEEPVDLAEDPITFAVVRRDGSWYLSYYYSLAETVRREANLPPPTLGAGPVPVGGATPEAALRELIEQLVELDAEGVLTRLDPVEAAVLYDYAPLFLPDLIGGAEQLRREADRTDVEWRLDEIETAAHEVNGRMVATVTVLAAHADVAGERLSFRADGECVAYDFGALGGADELCGDAGEEASARSGRDIPWPTDPVDSGVTVVERDGRWYVSVTPTLTYALRDVLATMEPDDVDAVVDGFRQAFEDMTLLLD